MTFPGGPGGFPEGVLAPCDALRIMVLYRSVPELIPARLVERAHAVRTGRRNGGLKAGQGGIQAAAAAAAQEQESQPQKVQAEDVAAAAAAAVAVVFATSATESSGAETASAPSTAAGSAPGSPVAGVAALTPAARPTEELLAL
ncbi:hypothetical protein HK405_000681 [Cladochytrium tenue]|nr:hypothetical protein HK405_000681 [Cladochytrium tenue]